MKALASIASIAVVIVAFAAPSQGAPQTSVSGKECSKAAASRGERPGSKSYVQFMQQCKAGKVPLSGAGTGGTAPRPSQYNY
jgi:cytochrome c5